MGSCIYSNAKRRACEDFGIPTIEVALPEDISQESIQTRVKEINNDEKVSGILVELPIPRRLDAQRIFDEISPEKDVDGVTPFNVASKEFIIILMVTL